MQVPTSNKPIANGHHSKSAGYRKNKPLIELSDSSTEEINSDDDDTEK